MMKYSSPVFQLKILINGRHIQEYHKDALTYVEGREGSKYTLELTNLTFRRLLAHPTVDGLSVMDGKPASLQDNNGYVLAPSQRLCVPGWRLNDQEVAEFVFAGRGESYSEKAGHGSLNIGVIACAVWEEASVAACTFTEHIWHTGVTPRGTSGCNFHEDIAHNGTVTECQCNFSTEQPSVAVPSIGTGFGKTAEHHVYSVQFARATESPLLVAEIRYGTIQQLEHWGIRVHGSQPRPNPFPRDTGCTPPPGWRR